MEEHSTHKQLAQHDSGQQDSTGDGADEAVGGEGSEKSDQLEKSDTPGKSGVGVDLDTHRGFVREMNNAFSSVYGYGGAAVLALTASVVALAANFGWLASPLVWIATVVVFLVALFVLRIVVRRRAERLHHRIQQYCALNDIPVDEFRDRFKAEGVYPYLESIFEVIERRQELRNQLRERESK
jgi:uncharacterized membrane protein